MALKGMTVTQTVRYVSTSDPSRLTRQVFNDPADETKGFRMETDIEASAENGATVFDLAPIDLFNMGRIHDSSTKVTRSAGEEFGFATRVNETNIETTRMGLKGWTNFLDDASNSIKFETIKRNISGRDYVLVDDVSMNALGLTLANELGREIKRISEVGKAEVKNSVSA